MNFQLNEDIVLGSKLIRKGSILKVADKHMSLPIKLRMVKDTQLAISDASDNVDELLNYNADSDFLALLQGELGDVQELAGYVKEELKEKGDTTFEWQKSNKS